MKVYKHLFFDLDRTLWDLDTNARDTIHDLYVNHEILEKGVTDFENFLKTYTHFNNMLWDAYRKGEIRKEVLNVERFRLTLAHFQIYDQGLPLSMANDYVEISPTKTALYDGTIETLEYLSPKYSMHIITNGFLETQHRKLSHSKIDSFFDKVIISEVAGCMKPDQRIFDYALKQADAIKDESIMIGDDPVVDILAAKHFGMDQVYVNYQKESIAEKPTFEISSLLELKELL